MNNEPKFVEFVSNLLDIIIRIGIPFLIGLFFYMFIYYFTTVEKQDLTRLHEMDVRIPTFHQVHQVQNLENR